MDWDRRTAAGSAAPGERARVATRSRRIRRREMLGIGELGRLVGIKHRGRPAPPSPARADWLDRFPWVLLRLARAGSGHAVGTLSVWLWWDRFAAHHWNIRPIQPGAMFSVNLAHHAGAEVLLRDGTLIRPGDGVLELHFANANLTRLLGEGLTTWSGVRRARQELTLLTARIAAGDYGEVRAIHGVSLFAETGKRLGFEFRPLPHTWRWALERYFMIGLLIIYHPEGWRRARPTRSAPPTSTGSAAARN